MVLNQGSIEPLKFRDANFRLSTVEIKLEQEYFVPRIPLCFLLEQNCSNL